MENKKTDGPDNYWIEVLKKYNRLKREELRKDQTERPDPVVLNPMDIHISARMQKIIPSKEIIEQQSNVEQQVASMADMLILLDTENPNFISEIIDCEEGGKIRKEQEEHLLSNIHERMLLSIDKTFRYIKLQTALILAMENKETQEKIEKEARRQYSWYFSNPNKIVKRYMSSIKRELGKDGEFSSAIYGENWNDNSALKDSIIVKYIMNWCREMIEGAKYYEFLKTLKLNQFRNILVDRETVKSLDKLASQLGYDDVEKLVCSNIFTKYATRCMETAAVWLDERAESLEIFSLKKGKKENYHAFEYIQSIFDDILLMNQNPNENITRYSIAEFIPLERSPMGIVFDLIRCIKWYPKFGHEDEKKALFYEAVLNCSAACAAIEFKGADIHDLSDTNLIRLSKLTDPEWFIINLFYSYLINQMAVEYREKDLDAWKLVHREYENLSSKEREESRTSIQRLKEQIEDQTKKIEQLQSTIHWKNNKDEEVDRLVADKTADLNEEIRILEKKIRKMQDTLLEKDSLIEEQKAQLSDYEEILKYREETVSAENEEYSQDELKHQIFLFVGGHENLLAELRKELPLCKFFANPTDPMPDMRKIDRVVIFYKFTNHSAFNMVMPIARQYKIPVQYIDKKNFNQVLRELKRKL